MNCQLLPWLVVALRGMVYHLEENSFDHPVDKLVIHLE